MARNSIRRSAHPHTWNVCGLCLSLGFYLEATEGHSLVSSAFGPKTIFQVGGKAHPQINAYPLQGLLTRIRKEKQQS